MIFDDEILEKIFAKHEVCRIPLIHQSAMIRAIEEVLEEMGVDVHANILH